MIWCASAIPESQQLARIVLDVLERSPGFSMPEVRRPASKHLMDLRDGFLQVEVQPLRFAEAVSYRLADSLHRLGAGPAGGSALVPVALSQVGQPVVESKEVESFVLP